MSQRILIAIGLIGLMTQIYPGKQTPDEMLQRGDLSTELKNLEGDRLLVLYRLPVEGTTYPDVSEYPVTVDKSKPDKTFFVNVHSDKFIDKVAGSEFKVAYYDLPKKNIGLALLTRKGKVKPEASSEKKEPPKDEGKKEEKKTDDKKPAEKEGK